MKKSTKLLTRSVTHRNSWTGSRNIKFQLSKPFSTMVNPVLNWTTYGTPFTTHLTLHNLTRSISNCWMKSLVKTSKCGHCSHEKSLSIPLKNNNSLASGPDKLSWSHIKRIIKNDKCIIKLIDIANIYIDLGYWPSYFKTFMTIIIPKPNKALYDSPKSFHPIVLLNTMGKLFKKMIRERMQFLTISNDFIHPCQLDGLKHRSTMDAGITLTHLIQSGQVKNLTTSTLAFDITQFFLSLNHQLLSLILDKTGLDQKVLAFFKNYLVGRKTKYLWNRFLSPFCNINIGVGQDSALSSILSALYFSPIFHILEKQLKILKIPISIISFVDDGLFISQNKSISLLNANLFCSYNVISSLFMKFGLVMEYKKTEVFYFSRLHGVFNPHPLDLTPIRGPVLLHKTTWQYLEFFFD